MKRKAHFHWTLAAEGSFERFGRKSKREQFLDEMDQVVPWAGLLALVEPYYPKAGNGRRPVGLEIMLRAYFVEWLLRCESSPPKTRLVYLLMEFGRGTIPDSPPPFFAGNYGSPEV